VKEAKRSERRVDSHNWTFRLGLSLSLLDRLLPLFIFRAKDIWDKPDYTLLKELSSVSWKTESMAFLEVMVVVVVVVVALADNDS
jgi:hypothetical protein